MLTAGIKRKALKLGYSACGVVPSGICHEYGRYLDDRVKSFPESRELYDPLHELANPPENAKTIIICTQRYDKYRIPAGLGGVIGKVYLFDGRVPYSYECRARVEFETYLKTLGINILQGRVPVRLVAARAGLGKFGRNCFLYDPDHGSYIWIDAWVIDKELDYDAVVDNITLPACNDGCLKCVHSCPTKALSGSLSMDRGKCITQLSCYAKNVLDGDTRSQMGAWLYGCDACQDACPLNRDKFAEAEAFPLLAEFEEYLKPERILTMDEDAYMNTIYPRFWYAGKDGLWLWKCNALRSMINSDEKKYYRLIRECCDHADTRIKEIAQWGCERLGL